MRLVRQTRTRARQPRMIGNFVAVRQPQEVAQRERVRATPRNAALAVDALEIADHVHAEVPPRRQRRRAHPRRVVGLAHPFHENVEPGLLQQLLQPVVERVSRRARHLRPRRHQVPLNRLRPTHRHRRSPATSQAEGISTSRLRQRAVRVDAVALRKPSQALLTMLYCSTDCLCRCGAPV